jgi:hypothetical protein
MIQDIAASVLSQDVEIAALVTGIRPVNASINDRKPYITYELVDWSSVLGLNCHTGYYEGTIRIYVVSSTHLECSALSEMVKTDLDGIRAEDTDYIMTMCRLIDEEDLGQQLDEREKPFYVKAIDFSVRGKKNLTGS